MIEHDDLDVALNARFTPPSPRGLNAWIIAEAQGMPQDQGGWRLYRAQVVVVMRDVWGDVRGALQMPQPAFVLAAFLVLGFSLGIYSDLFDMMPGIVTDDLSGFMLIEDRFVAAEFWDMGAL